MMMQQGRMGVAVPVAAQVHMVMGLRLRHQLPHRPQHKQRPRPLPRLLPQQLVAHSRATS